uniref:Thylakoid-associated protein n=1 Tax=Cyanothece sp. (strain PCC 7425 / ATCC 29141) TaxID=395961 RepID=B8HQK3_CYAP4
MATSINARQIEDLAADIGKNVYIDVAKWHLYLAEAHLHTVLAERLYPLLQPGQLSEDQVTQVLAQIPVKLGGGRRELPLTDLLPMQSMVNLMDILEEFQRQL